MSHAGLVTGPTGLHNGKMAAAGDPAAAIVSFQDRLVDHAQSVSRTTLAPVCSS